ncbi:MAG: NADH-quinone oxidoreductase subunit C, partial [Burkholderiaceae bacterium]
MSEKINRLETAVQALLGERLQSLESRLGELTLTVAAAEYLAVCRLLRDHESLRFEQLIDLCGVDYQGYGDGMTQGPRFAVVLHLIS